MNFNRCCNLRIALAFALALFVPATLRAKPEPATSAKSNASKAHLLEEAKHHDHETASENDEKADEHHKPKPASSKASNAHEDQIHEHVNESRAEAKNREEQNDLRLRKKFLLLGERREKQEEHNMENASEAKALAALNEEHPKATEKKVAVEEKEHRRKRIHLLPPTIIPAVTNLSVTNLPATTQ